MFANDFFYSVKSASAVVKDSGGGVHSVTLTAGSDPATLILYDNPAAASGSKIWQLSAVANTSISAVIDAPFGQGCYMALTGTSSFGCIAYR